MASAIFVRGFDFGTSEGQIRQHCSSVGPVGNVEMWGKGGAVVTFRSPSAASLAAQKLNKTTIPGNSRFVDVKIDDRQDRGSNKRPFSSLEGGVTRVYIRGFDFGTSDEQLEGHCGTVGSIVKVLWTTKGSAIVEYSNPQEAAAAVEHLNGTTIEGNSRYIEVKEDEEQKTGREGPKRPRFDKGKGKGKGKSSWGWDSWGSSYGKKGGFKGSKGGKGKSHPKGPEDQPGSGRVFVRGFDIGTTDDQLIRHMSSAGEVANVHWVNKGNAIVVFSKSQAAQMAISTLNNTTIPGNKRYIEVIPRDSH